MVSGEYTLLNIYRAKCLSISSMVGPFIFYPRDEDVPLEAAKGTNKMFDGVSLD